MAGFVIPVFSSALEAIPVTGAQLLPQPSDSLSLVGPESPFALEVEYALLEESGQVSAENALPISKPLVETAPFISRQPVENAPVISRPPSSKNSDQDGEDELDAAIAAAPSPVQLSAPTPTRRFDWTISAFPLASSPTEDAVPATSDAPDTSLETPAATTAPNAIPLYAAATSTIAPDLPVQPPPTTDVPSLRNAAPPTEGQETVELAPARAAIDAFSVRIFTRTPPPDARLEAPPPQPPEPVPSPLDARPGAPSSEAFNIDARTPEAPEYASSIARNATLLPLHAPVPHPIASNGGGMQFGPDSGADHAPPQPDVSDVPPASAEHPRAHAAHPEPDASPADDTPLDRPTAPVMQPATAAGAPPATASDLSSVAHVETPPTSNAPPRPDTVKHLDRAMELQTPEAHQSAPGSSVSSLRLQLTTPTGHSIDLRIREHQGLLRVDTRSSDAGIASDLRNDVPRLIESLHASGFGVEVETPVHRAGSAALNQDSSGESMDSPNKQTFVDDRGRQGRGRGQHRGGQDRQENDFE